MEEDKPLAQGPAPKDAQLMVPSQDAGEPNEYGQVSSKAR